MIFKAFALGLSTGAFCMGFCAPVLMGLLLSRSGEGWKGNALSIGLFLGGRLLAYLLFGFISFYIGEVFRGQRFFINLLPIGEILLGLLMMIYAVHMQFPHLSLCGSAFRWSDSRWTLFAAGVFTGMNLCPPFIMAVGMAAESADLFQSLLFFLIFFATTSIYLLPFLFSASAARSGNIRSAARIVCGLTGIWFMGSGLQKLLFL